RQKPGTGPRQRSSAPRPLRAARTPPGVPPWPDSRWSARRRTRSRCRGKTGNSTHRATWNSSVTQQSAPYVANFAGHRHSIVKERLTDNRCDLVCAWLGLHRRRRNHAEFPLAVAYSRGDSAPASNSTDAFFMTLLSTAQHIARDTRRDPRSHMLLIMVAVTITAGAVALVAYLLWPTWVARPTSAPDRLPVSVGATLFNV